MVSNNDTEHSLRLILTKMHYGLSVNKTNGQNGVDILASKRNRTYFIEVIGYKKSGPARSKDFYEAFFRSASRLNMGAEFCVLALPIEFKRGFSVRMNNIKEFMKRVIVIFPEFRIWFVDTVNQRVEICRLKKYL